MEKQLSVLQPVLDVPFIRRTRRNHGLEHATIHLLSRKLPRLAMVGRSDAGGFWLYGEVDTALVESCAAEALRRMQGGEHQLAIHPNCGTNLVTTAAIGAVGVGAALLGLERGRERYFSRLPLVMLALMGALVIGQPAGTYLQRHVTTLGDPGDLIITSIKRTERVGLVMHRVATISS